MQRARRTGLALASLVAVSLAAPSAASAHAVSGIDYRFPLPIWLFALAAGVAVLASAPAAMFAVRSEKTWTGRDFYGSIRRLRLGTIGLVIFTAALLDALFGGLFGPEDFFENPVTIVVWVDFWVGLGIVTALVGNAWDFVSPLSAAGRALERALATRGASVVRYPERLGLWPAIALVLLWSWMELVWDAAKSRSRSRSSCSPTSPSSSSRWRCSGPRSGSRAGSSSLWSRGLSPASPPSSSPCAGRRVPCRADRCIEEERIGCPSCWLDAAPEERAMRLRTYGSGVRREPPLGVGGGTFVLALLATVVYDGFSQTQQYVDLGGWFIDRSNWLALHVTTLDTMLMVAVVAAVFARLLVVVTVVSRLEGRPVADAARRYAPTLIPIAAVYFVSHYFLYLIYAGQFTWAG